MAKRIAPFIIAAAVLCVGPALAAESQMQGIIVTHQDQVITIKTPSGNQRITLAPDVRVRSISGAFSANKQIQPVSSLIPGLPVTVVLDDASGQQVAHEVDYKLKEYNTAAQIQAGVEETARREAELRHAYKKMGDWDVRAERNVYFKTGSAVISQEGRQQLTDLAVEAKTYRGYVISVLGHADPRGNAAANERLSNRRAQAVINYLKQSGHLQPARVLSASAMGEMNIPLESAAEAQAEARKVTIRVLTSAAHLKD